MPRPLIFLCILAAIAGFIFAQRPAWESWVRSDPVEYAAHYFKDPVAGDCRSFTTSDHPGHFAVSCAWNNH